MKSELQEVVADSDGLLEFPAEGIIFAFDRFKLDAVERRLTYDGGIVSITPKAFDLLVLLVARSGKAIGKDTILDKVWPEVYVQESTLMQNVHTLRRLFKTYSPDLEFIETVPRLGYRFSCPVNRVLETTYATNGHLALVAPQPNLEGQGLNLASIENSNQPASRRVGKVVPRVAIASLAVLVASFLALQFLAQRKPLSLSSFKEFSVSKLTNTGDVRLVAVSSDAKFIAYVEETADSQSLFVRELDNATSVEIVPRVRQWFIGLNFSPDDQQLYFVSYDFTRPDAKSTGGILYRTPRLGGAITRIADHVSSSVATSNDGNTLSYIRDFDDENRSVLVTSSLSDKSEKRLLDLPLSSMFAPYGIDWSRDGKRIVVTVPMGNQKMGLLVIDPQGQAEPETLPGEWAWVGQPRWLADGTGIVFLLLNDVHTESQGELWEIGFPNGQKRKIASNITRICGIGMSRDSRVLVGVKAERFSILSVQTVAAEADGTRILQNTSESNFGSPGLAWPNEGPVFYSVSFDGNDDIWQIDADGGNKKQITSGPAVEVMPVTSASTTTVFFISNRSGKFNLWSKDLHTFAERQLTDEEDVKDPSLTADGRQIFFTSRKNADSGWELWRMSTADGIRQFVTKFDGQLPRVSPDGKFVACYLPSAKETDSQVQVSLISSADGSVVHQYQTIRNQELLPIAWRDSSSFTYVTPYEAGSRLWAQNLDVPPPRVILDSPSKKIYQFCWNGNGKQILLEQGATTHDIVMITSDH